jgi:hypothetical protein
MCVKGEIEPEEQLLDAEMILGTDTVFEHSEKITSSVIRPAITFRGWDSHSFVVIFHGLRDEGLKLLYS